MLNSVFRKWRNLLLFFGLIYGCSSVAICQETKNWIPPRIEEIHLRFVDQDQDPLEISGVLTITRPKKEDNIVNYQVFWGINSQTPLPFHGVLCSGGGVEATSRKSQCQKIETITPQSNQGYSTNKECFVNRESKGDSHAIEYHFEKNTPVPEGASHLLVYATSDYCKRMLAASVRIEDKGLPLIVAKDVTMIDDDPDMGQLGGKLSITRAEDEARINAYILYWGSASDIKLPEFSPLAIISKGISWPDFIDDTLVYQIPEDTEIPESATHILAFVRTALGEMKHGISWKIADLGCVCDLRCNDNWYQEEEKINCLYRFKPIAGMIFDGTFRKDSGDGEQSEERLEGAIWLTKGRRSIEARYYLLYWGDAEKEKLDGYGPIVVAQNNFLERNTQKILIDSQKPPPPEARYFLLYTRSASDEEFSDEIVFKIPLKISKNKKKWTLGFSLLSHQLDENELFEMDFLRENISLFWGRFLKKNILLKVQYNYGKKNLDSLGENIVGIERNLLSGNIHWFFADDFTEWAFSSKINQSRWYGGLKDSVVGMGLGFGRVFMRYDAREFFRERTEDGDLLEIEIQNLRQTYKSIDNRVFFKFDLGWHSRHSPYHFGIQCFLPLIYDNNFDREKIPAFSDHREKAKTAWKDFLRMRQVYVGAHF